MNPSSRTDPSLAPRDQTTVLIVTALVGFLATFMGSAVNIALPLIGSDFQASAVTLSWISLTYILAAEAVLTPVGRMADLYGRKRVFVWGILVFATVGRHVIEPVDNLNLLTSVRICFAILTLLCVLGIAASLVGPRRNERAPMAAEGPTP